MLSIFKPPDVSSHDAKLQLQARGCKNAKGHNARLRLKVMLIQEYCEKHNIASVEVNVMDLLQSEHAKNSGFYGPFTFKGVTPRKNSRQNKYYTFYRAVNPGQPEPPKIHISTWKFNEQFVEKGGMSLESYIKSKEKLKTVAGPFMPPLSLSASSTVAESDVETDTDDS